MLHSFPIDLLDSSPVAAHDRILDRIDYGLYYMRRKKGLAWLEAVKNEWVGFLRAGYKDGESLAAAWGEKIDRIGNDFERVPYPVTAGEHRTHVWR